MSEFDEKLNNILGNPDAMAQIMQLAQSLSGEGKKGPSPSPVYTSPKSESQSSSVSEQNRFSPNSDIFSSLTGGMDPKIIMKLLPLIQELGDQQDTHARQLLYALRPYLKTERQEKVERALQLARLFHLGKKFLAGWEV